MYILNMKGEVISSDNDTSFGWWLSDIIPEKYYTRNQNGEENIGVQIVNTVENPNVSHEICENCEENNQEIVFIPPVEKITQLLDESNSRDRLLLAIIHPAMWNKIYNNDPTSCPNKKIKRNIVSNKINNINYDSVIKKLKLNSDEPVSSLETKFKELDNLLKDVKEEIFDMHRTLKDLKQSYIEEENCIEELIQKSVCYTQDILDTKFLDDILLFSNNKLNSNVIKNWPFYTNSTITYSNTQRNFII